MSKTKILLFANTGWYIYNYRRSLIKEIRRSGAIVILVSPHDEYVHQLQSEGFTWYRLNLTRRGMNPFRELFSLLQLISLYRRVRPSLAHHFTIKPILYGSIAARLAGVPAVVNSITGLGYVFLRAGWRGHMLRALLLPIFRVALGGERTRSIFQNPQDRETFVMQGLVREENATLIRGSGVDTDYFQPTPEVDGPPVVVMASRMLWDKGVEDLVAAARLLNEWEVPGSVTLVGAPDPGNPHSISEDKLLEWDREGVIRWLGHRDDMTSIYAQSHLVVLPTTYYEGLPRSLLEGAACGRPLVATDIPGCREIVLDGENGFLVPPHDPKAIAEALRKLIVNPELRREMGLKSRSLVLEHFSAKTINSQTIEVYDALVGEH